MGLNRSSRNQGRQLIILTKPGVDQIWSTAIAEAPSEALASLDNILRVHNAQISPVHQSQIGPERPTATWLQEGASAAEQKEINDRVERYHHVIAVDDELESLKTELKMHPMVEAAYIKPGSETAGLTLVRQKQDVNIVPALGSITPDFTSRQDYHLPAPVGVDVLSAWRINGGRGAGVQVIDCEWEWNFTHEDLTGCTRGNAIGTPLNDGEDHGTAVIGEIIGNPNEFGITGIAPDTSLRTACLGDSLPRTTSSVIMQASDMLNPGDILLLEIHRPGPDHYESKGSQNGFIPIEWWPDDFDAIRYSVGRGTIVVEAGGNGGVNLDATIYDKPLPDFPSSWRNPFSSGGRDSGAIIVGAGNPPAKTHGRSFDTYGYNEQYVDRARCVFSNFGSRIDCQGWGWEVTTTGYGDLQPGAGNVATFDRNRLYTDTFAGTSSASPIIVGVLACVQGILRAANRSLLTPISSRDILRTTGSPQQSGPGRPTSERIGSRPDLNAILVKLMPLQAPYNRLVVNFRRLLMIPRKWWRIPS